MKRKLLFVCMANLNRSPTFAKFVGNYCQNLEVKSCGVYYGYPDKLNRELLEWADKAYVMDLEQEEFIAIHYHKYLDKVEMIGVSDQYHPDDVRLIELIKYWIKKKSRKLEVI